ncbi:MAG: zinc-binding dehydrogenase, partial [Burkholderiales bacterium]
GGTLTALPANRLLLHNASAVGVLWGEMRKREPALAADITREIYGWYAEGRLKLLPGRGYGFEQAPEGLAALDSRASVGKVWLEFA